MRKARWKWRWIGSHLLISIVFYLFDFRGPNHSILIQAATIKDFPLTDFIVHYEPLYYDHHHLRHQHQRCRRSMNGKPVRLQFFAHNRLFKVRLKKDESLFTEDFVVNVDDKIIEMDNEKNYVGFLEDNSSGDVEGIVTDEGLFDGAIYNTIDGDYYIEPTSRYARFSSGLPFHSIIYRSEDIASPHLFNTSKCRSSELALSFNRTKRWLKQKASDAEETSQLFPSPDGFIQRKLPTESQKSTCMLYLQADHLFMDRVGSVEACIETMTRHVQRVNAIYKAVDFDRNGHPDSISFMIKRIKVHTSKALLDPSYRFPGNYGVEKFLELFSEEDYDAFCLAYMFTYRDFEGGTLGLAWTGDLKNAGGVCEKNGYYRGSLKSLNTGIVTLLNYGKHVPPAVSHVTLAHEIGHNFGSPHDPEDNRICTPAGKDGNYIMFARATSGDKTNNNRFSPCSLRSINAVLNTKARGNRGCFTEPQESICGNEVVEIGEECDCGWEEDCEETCCFPMKVNPSKGYTPCKLRPNKTCSPSQGPCCNSHCRLKMGNKCRDDNGCRDASYCNGQGPQCPPSTNKPNKTVCNDEFVCYMGECTGSICVAYGLESCQCNMGIDDPITKACELCCKLPGDDQQCVSSFEWNNPPYDIPDMFAKPGTPCDNYNGYCDMFQKCREVDPSGPLATLRKLLLSNEGMAWLKKLISTKWWLVLIGAIGFLLIMIIIVKLCGKKPSELQIKAAAAASSGGHHLQGSNASSSSFSTPPPPFHQTVTIASTPGKNNLPGVTTTTNTATNTLQNGWV